MILASTCGRTIHWPTLTPPLQPLPAAAPAPESRACRFRRPSQSPTEHSLLRSEQGVTAYLKPPAPRGRVNQMFLANTLRNVAAGAPACRIRRTAPLVPSLLAGVGACTAVGSTTRRRQSRAVPAWRAGNQLADARDRSDREASTRHAQGQAASSHNAGNDALDRGRSSSALRRSASPQLDVTVGGARSSDQRDLEKASGVSRTADVWAFDAARQAQLEAVPRRGRGGVGTRVFDVGALRSFTHAQAHASPAC